MADYLGKKIKFNIEDNDLQKIRFNKAYGESQQATRSGKNLFDKDNANIINTYIAGSGNGVLPSDGGAENKCVYIPCKQNTTYTIQKMIGKRFGVAYTYETPAQGVMAYNKTVDNNVASITITTDSSAKYLVVYLRNGNASGEITLQQALDSLQIEKGSTATDYEPYGVMPSPDYRSKIENLEGKNLVQQMHWKQVPSITTGETVTTVHGYGTDFIEVDNTKNYIFSYSGTASSKYVAYYDESKNFLGHGTNLQIDSYANWNVTKYVRLRIDCSENAVTNLQLEEGTVATPYAPYNSLEIKDIGKNLYAGNEITINGTYSSNTSVDLGSRYLSKGTYTISLTNSLLNNCYIYLGASGSIVTAIRDKATFTLTEEQNVPMRLIVKAGTYSKFKTKIMIEKGMVVTDYEPHQQQTEYFPLSEGQKLMKGSYLADDGIHHSRKQVVFDGSDDENWTQNGPNQGYGIVIDNVGGNAVDKVTSSVLCDKLTAVPQSTIYTGSAINGVASIGGTMHKLYVRFDSSITTVALLREKLAESPILIEYELAEEEIVPYTETQQEAREKLRHFKGLNGENNITAQGTMTSTLDLTLYNVAEEDFDIYISKKGYFGALKYDINNLIDFTESNIPSIAEATESSVKIAGRDGDISLNTVYEPLPFEIVCYTEDNLTPEEKIIEEQKITSLLNSIKNQTKTFFMEREKKFYKVKYSGNLSVVRYPKHLKFTIPLKSSESYAMNFEESEIIGNGTKVSNTIKDTGAIFTIKGPATKPIISLNNYQMKYNENILEGNSLIINSEDSTITHITSAGVKTNAMRAYNHEFPKIKNGENQLAVSSGIDDEKQVNVKWYDLKI